MKKNIGKQDRLLRLAIAIVLLIIAFLTSSWLVLLASLFVFYEAIAGWCILYQILRKNSCPTEKNHK